MEVIVITSNSDSDSGATFALLDSDNKVTVTLADVSPSIVDSAPSLFETGELPRVKTKYQLTPIKHPVSPQLVDGGEVDLISENDIKCKQSTIMATIDKQGWALFTLGVCNHA